MFQQFLNKKPSDRLGSSPASERDVMGHAFYRRIDWDKIASREIQPPYKPKIVIRFDNLAFICFKTLYVDNAVHFGVPLA
jgi:hypothetical protein